MAVNTYMGDCFNFPSIISGENPRKFRKPKVDASLPKAQKEKSPNF